MQSRQRQLSNSKCPKSISQINSLEDSENSWHHHHLGDPTIGHGVHGLQIRLFHCHLRPCPDHSQNLGFHQNLHQSFDPGFPGHPHCLRHFACQKTWLPSGLGPSGRDPSQKPSSAASWLAFQAGSRPYQAYQQQQHRRHYRRRRQPQHLLHLACPYLPSSSY